MGQILDENGLPILDENDQPILDEGVDHAMSASGASVSTGRAPIRLVGPPNPGSRIWRRSANDTWIKVAELERWQEINWNSAWGIMEWGSFPANPGDPPSPRDTKWAASQIVDPLCTLQFQPQAGRTYRMTLQLRAVGPDGAYDIAGYFVPRRNGVNLPGSGIDPWKRGYAQWDTWRFDWVFTTAQLGTDMATYSVLFGNGTTLNWMWFDRPTCFYMEDIGPERA